MKSSFVLLFLFYISYFGVAEGIIGGHRANIAQFPYQVSVQVDKVHICGGAIIGKQHIMTAAHCIIDAEDEFKYVKFKIIAGDITLSYSHPSRVEVSVKKVYIPREFKKCDLNSESSCRDTGDIAILKLKRKLDLNTNSALNKVSLPNMQIDGNRAYVNERLVIAGYGATAVTERRDEHNRRTLSYSLKPPFHLKYIETRVIPNEQCTEIYICPLVDKHICVQAIRRNSETAESVCQGDSGGPLVRGDIVLGILGSSSDVCDEAQYPSVYTKVTSFISFIENAMQDIITPDMRVATLHKNKKLFGLITKDTGLVEITPP